MSTKFFLSSFPRQLPTILLVLVVLGLAPTQAQTTRYADHDALNDPDSGDPTTSNPREHSAPGAASGRTGGRTLEGVVQSDATGNLVQTRVNPADAEGLGAGSGGPPATREEPPEIQVPGLAWPDPGPPPRKPSPQPLSWTYSVALRDSVPAVALPPIDESVLRDEDAQRVLNGLPLRIGVGRDVHATLPDGRWYDIPGVGRLWVLDIQSPNALGIRVHFVDMDLPPGARLVVYSLDDPTRLAGPYRLRGVHGHGRLWTPTRFGDTLRVEYLEPTSQLRDSSGVPFHIDQIQHVYFDPISTLRDMDPCRIDVTCYPAWVQLSHAVAGIGTIDDDSIWCTGTLVSNLGSDFAPFFWTANHCIPDVESPENAEVYWLYQSQTPCADNPPSLASVPQSAVLHLLSHGGFGFTGDYSLNLIEGTLPIYEVYWAGFNTGYYAPTTDVVCIHHPGQSHKRISFGHIVGPNPIFWNIYEILWSQGGIEGGSSGAGLFLASTQRLIGHLSAGSDPCAADAAFPSWAFIDQWVADFLGGTWSDKEDNLESNDDCSSATTLAAGFYPDLVVRRYGGGLQYGSDWYRITLPAGQTLTATLDFTHDWGNIDAAIHMACGQSPFLIADGTDDGESLLLQNNGATQDVFLHVYLADDVRNQYSLSIFLSANPATSINVNISSVTPNPVQPNAPVTVSGSADYNNGAPIPAATATISVGGSQWTAPVLGGSFSREIAAPPSEGNYVITVSVTDGSLSGFNTASLQVTEEGGGGGCDYDLQETCLVYQVDEPSEEWWCKDVFRTTDVYVGGVIDLRNVECPLGLKWIWYWPDGGQYFGELVSSLANPVPPPNFYWYWHKKYINGDPMSYVLGRYRLKMYIDSGSGYRLIASMPYVVGWEYKEGVMCRNVLSSYPYTPSGITDVFYQDEARMYTWTMVENIAQDTELRCRFYEPRQTPGGANYYWETNESNAPGYSIHGPAGPHDKGDRYISSAAIDIAGASAAQKCGLWSSRVEYRHPTTNVWTILYEDTFQILERPPVNPFVSVTAVPLNPCEGEAITLNVTATDNTYLEQVEVHWRVDGVEQSPQTWDHLYLGQVQRTASIGAFNGGQQIEFWAVAIDTSGNRIESGHQALTLRWPPIITSHPSDATVCAGSNITFTVGATGSGSLSYQWYKNVAPVGTNSPTLTLLNVQLGDNGASIRCDVTNICGTASSNSATLTVCPCDLMVTYPSAGGVFQAGGTEVITWTSANPTGSVWLYLYRGDQWIQNIAYVPMADGAFSWDICTAIGDGTDYSIRLSRYEDCGQWFEAISGTFTITGSAPRPTLALTSPMSGDAWQAGTTQTITWSSTNATGNVEIWLQKGGDPYYDWIGHMPMSAGSFTWDICPSIGDGMDYTISVEWYECGPPVEATSNPFSITGSSPRPTLTVTSPAGGETWQAGSTETITWASTNGIGDVEIELYKGGDSYMHLGSVPVSAGSFTWDICDAIGDGTDYTIRISAYNSCAGWLEAFSNPFTITGSFYPTLTVTSPAGGETWQAGARQTITWTSTNPTGYVWLELYKAGEWYAYTESGYVPMSDGAFSWYICQTIGDGNDYTIRITSSDGCGPAIEAVSSVFAITGSAPRPTLTLVSPAGGQTWQSGSPQTIRWTSMNPTGYVSLELYRGDEYIQNMGAAPTSAGVFSWDICTAVGDGTDYTIRIVWYECAPPVEATSNPFSITGSSPRPTLTVTNPTGGQTWQAGSTQMITWISTNPAGSVSVDLYRMDQNIQHVGDASMSAGVFSWDICAAVGDGNDYTIRVTCSDCGPTIEAVSSVFAITGSAPRPTLTLVSPAGGQPCPAGSTQTITWTSTNAIGNIEIWLIADWRWQYIGDAPMDAGTLNWVVSPYLGDGTYYRVFVWQGDCGAFLSEVGQAFMITGSHLLGDCDGDGDVDLTDYGILQGCLAGPLVPSVTDCGGDGDVDLIDFTGWERCLDGPAVSPSSQCILMDLDGDNDVDVRDFALFARDFTGAEGPLPPGCEAADFDIDRDVDLYDFAMFQQAFSQ